MPRYQVTGVGFFGGVLRSPTKHNVVHTDAPLKKVPSWLKLMAEESPQAKAARTKKENAAKKAAAERAEQDQKDIDAVTFVEAAPGAAEVAGVTTL